MTASRRFTRDDSENEAQWPKASVRERLRDRGTVSVLALALVLLSATVFDIGGDEDVELAFAFWICVAVAMLGVVAVHTSQALRQPRSSQGSRRG